MPRSALLLLLLTACDELTLEPEQGAWLHVVYDPSAGAVPMPNDLLRDADAGRLALPTDGELTAADRGVRTWLSTLDAWPTTLPASVSFSDAVDPVTVTADTVQVWAWGNPPQRVPDLVIEVADDGRSVKIQPPLAGWDKGGRYAVVVRGDGAGVRDLEGTPFRADAAMLFLRSTQPLTEHEHAFPGATREERLASARTLETTRLQLAPWFDVVGLDREQIGALWTFSVTERTELAMDKASQRIPVPFDLLFDPTTGLVDLDPAPWDTPLEADAKAVASTLDGFGLSADLLFEFNGGIDPSTVDSGSVQLWDVSGTPVRVPSNVYVMSDDGVAGCTRAPYALDCNHVVVTLPPDQIPLKGATTYALLVTDDVNDLDGNPVAAMPIGTFVASDAPVLDQGRSQLAGVSDADALRLEHARAEVDALLDQVGREHVVAAWPFTTMDVLPEIEDSANLAERAALDLPPTIEWRRPASSVLEDDALGVLFPGALNPGPALYGGRVDGVKQVVSGTIPAPDFLDDVSRRWKTPNDTEPLAFWAATPADYNAQRDLPVVVFGHAIVTDRRFLVTIAGELTRRGFVVVGVDFPYHGRRVACVEASLVAVPNFLPTQLQSLTGLTDPLLWLPPCASGADATCSDTGECLDARGRPEAFAKFPIIDMMPVSGAAFLDTNDLPHIPDHFHQALVDLSALTWSLKDHEADWERALQQRIDPDRLFFVGQSLGSILGTVWVAGRDDVERGVFNVPGSNLVDLFSRSTYFKPQIDDTFRRLDIPQGSYDQVRLLSVATWIIDSVDPHSVAHTYVERDFKGFLQMDKVDANSGDLIIPNFTTENLARVSGLPIKSYDSILHADLIIPGLGDAMLDDLGAFLGKVP